MGGLSRKGWCGEAPVTSDSASESCHGEKPPLTHTDGDENCGRSDVTLTQMSTCLDVDGQRPGLKQEEMTWKRTETREDTGRDESRRVDTKIREDTSRHESGSRFNTLNVVNLVTAQVVKLQRTVETICVEFEPASLRLQPQSLSFILNCSRSSSLFYRSVGLDQFNESHKIQFLDQQCDFFGFEPASLRAVDSSVADKPIAPSRALPIPVISAGAFDSSLI
ncbi:hypothetical protein F2P81_002678 [Scophthalmus maximus]|uniref:Uncharacterized protein n=1 Tax=Scophthalmus maximus TaxID=52904 RepID=A0A6A4TMT4_SCOMX|nr:hypothetical protein F2P81_002678 [Scophthalmus maximus]